MDKMIQSIIKRSQLAAAAAMAVLMVGAISCSRQDAPEVPEALEVVDHASFAMSTGFDGTRASFSGSQLDWQTGDKLVMASNGRINGTLVCTSVDGSGVATFSGDISGFTPASVNLYFLGNREADGMNPQFDFSGQTGSLMNMASYTFLKKTGLELVENADGSYAPAAQVSFEGMTTMLNLTLNPAGSPAASGDAVATGVRIDGMRNCMSVNLADGTVTPVFMKMLDQTTDKTVTMVSPVSTADYANSYIIAVIPQNATNLTMQVSYIKSDASTETTMWSGINWDMSSTAGSSVQTDWTSTGKTPTIATTSQKGGYGGQAVEGGENADGQNHKNGYSGVNVGDESDNPQGSKPGYTGAEVL